MHEVLVNRLGGLSLPRKSVVRLTDRPDMTLDVYRGRKTTIHTYIRVVKSITRLEPKSKQTVLRDLYGLRMSPSKNGNFVISNQNH